MCNVSSYLLLLVVESIAQGLLVGGGLTPGLRQLLEEVRDALVGGLGLLLLGTEGLLLLLDDFLQGGDLAFLGGMSGLDSSQVKQLKVYRTV